MDVYLKLANAVAVQGFATVDLRTIAYTPFVRLDRAIQSASTAYKAGESPEWNLIASHLVSLKGMGVGTVAIRSDGRIVRLVISRRSPDGVLDIPEALSFLSALDQWADRFSRLLPNYSLPAKREKLFESASSWVGNYTGEESIKWIASKLLYLFSRASGAGSCIVVNPVKSASSQYVDSWRHADLQREHLFTGRMHTASYLWTLSDGRILAGDGGNVDMNYRPYPEELQVVLANALDH